MSLSQNLSLRAFAYLVCYSSCYALVFVNGHTPHTAFVLCKYTAQCLRQQEKCLSTYKTSSNAKSTLKSVRRQQEVDAYDNKKCFSTHEISSIVHANAFVDNRKSSIFYLHFFQGMKTVLLTSLSRISAKLPIEPILPMSRKVQ